MTNLRSRILSFIEKRPGASTTAVRRAVSGKTARVSDALSALEAEGKIRNEGNGSGHSWHPMDGSGDEGFFVPPREVPDSAPEEIEGLPVAGWLTPGAAAELFDVTPRTLSRWEGKGFPSWGSGSGKLIPTPHAVIWAVEYGIAKDRERGGVSGLDLGVALARANLRRRENGEQSIYDLSAVTVSKP